MFLRFRQMSLNYYQCTLNYQLMDPRASTLWSICSAPPNNISPHFGPNLKKCILKTIHCISEKYLLILIILPPLWNQTGILVWTHPPPYKGRLTGKNFQRPFFEYEFWGTLLEQWYGICVSTSKFWRHFF